MKILLCTLLAVTALSAQPTYEERRKVLIRYMADSPGPDPQRWGMSTLAAKLYLREDTARVSTRLSELLKEPSGDMFWMFVAAAVRQLGEGQLSPKALADLRHAWKTYFPYRGDTENHWLLYYASLYIASQNEPNAEWFTGKTSQQNMQEAKDYVKHWVNLTLAKGQGEYDCTHYIGVYLLPLAYLAGWSKDPELKQLSTMMLEYVAADMAHELLDGGIYVGSHARTDDVQVLEKYAGVSSNAAWLLYDLGPREKTPLQPHYMTFYALSSPWQPPAVLHKIATDRSKSYLVREKKRTRNRWRFHDDKHGPVYKTTYMTPRYAVSSDQGGVLQPIQQHSWDVTWRVDDPRGVHNTLFTTHPYSSAHELQTYFTPMPDYFLDEVLRSKKTYDSPDKWIGGSPYEQIIQDQDTVIALYDIPAGTRFPHIHGFFSKDLLQLKEDPSGWIFAQGGDTYLAYFPLAPYQWKQMANGGRELFSPHLKNGAIVQAADKSEFASFDDFQAKIRALPLKHSTAPTPQVDFTTLRGKRLQFTYGQSPISRTNWPMFDSPFLKQAPGSRKLELRHGNLRRVLDFDNLKILE
ncbi:hypothetical protein F183_A47320 [Bryobacterales bacterium F-183]|nr:hypothetical protein F183_A47320 [Bryobacterales bacterium F-183]